MVVVGGWWLVVTCMVAEIFECMVGDTAFGWLAQWTPLVSI